ncbi:MAG: 4'-phosphopantetheinyl transferase superfamily protein, partial [Gemmatimonadetes bacterium]|nr:4'-phosphopantetheinyl transferase superfamily protein [Gemmatimonadota bacterium]
MPSSEPLMTISWETPSSWPRLSDDEIHVWCVELDAAGKEAALAACLSEEERGRASGLLSGTHQRRFVAARGMLRQLLGRYLGQDPGAVAFARGAHGKPFLTEGGLDFNVSHTHELALYAIARDREVGVDVEWMRPQVAHEQIAARFFSLEEQEALAQVPDEERRAAFYNIWT